MAGDQDNSLNLLLPEGVSEETQRMLISQLYRAQMKQGGMIDRQGIILARQQEMVEDILNKISAMAVSLRGPEDGSSPGLQELVRKIRSEIDSFKQFKEEVRAEQEKEAQEEKERNLAFRSKVEELSNNQRDLVNEVASIKKTQDSQATWKRDLLMALIAVLITAVTNWVIQGGLS